MNWSSPSAPRRDRRSGCRARASSSRGRCSPSLEGVAQPRRPSGAVGQSLTPVGVAELERVDVGVAPDVRLVRRHRARSRARSSRPGSRSGRRRRSRSRGSRRRSGRAGSSSCRTGCRRRRRRADRGRRCRGSGSRRRCRCRRSARMRLFWCVWTSSPTRRSTLPTSAKIIPFGIGRSASTSLPGTVSLSSAKRASRPRSGRDPRRCRARLAHREADVAERRVREARAAGRRRSRSGRCCRAPRAPRRRRSRRAGHACESEFVRRRARSRSRGRCATWPIEPPLASMSIVWPRTSAAASFSASMIEPARLRSETLPVERSSVAGGLDHADVHVAGDLVEVDAERAVVVRREVVRVDVPERAAGDRVGVDLEEVARQADPADAGHLAADAVVAGGQDDVATGGDVDAVRAARRVAVVTPLRGRTDRRKSGRRRRPAPCRRCPAARRR